MTKDQVISDIDKLTEINGKTYLSTEKAKWEEVGKAFAESILSIINEPVRPYSFRWLLGEDKSKRVYDFPRPSKKVNL
jgi:hypothetical protein